MSSKLEATSEELPPTKEWNIPEEIEVLLKSGVIDGVNMRKTYRLVQNCDVAALMFKVDGL